MTDSRPEPYYNDLMTHQDINDIVYDHLLEHKDTLQRLMDVRSCKNREEIMALGVTPDQLTKLIGPATCFDDYTSQIPALDDKTYKIRLRDKELAKTLMITPKRWNYVKQLLLKPPSPSPRYIKR